MADSCLLRLKKVKPSGRGVSAEVLEQSRRHSAQPSTLMEEAEKFNLNLNKLSLALKPTPHGWGRLHKFEGQGGLQASLRPAWATS